jgi:hypothetical protein
MYCVCSTCTRVVSNEACTLLLVLDFTTASAWVGRDSRLPRAAEVLIFWGASRPIPADAWGFARCSVAVRRGHTWSPWPCGGRARGAPATRGAWRWRWRWRLCGALLPRRCSLRARTVCRPSTTAGHALLVLILGAGMHALAGRGRVSVVAVWASGPVGLLWVCGCACACAHQRAP